jgi:predicted phage terminase large subunit-like protein
MTKDEYIKWLQYYKIVTDSYLLYVEHVHKGRWIPGKAVSYICDQIQQFIEDDTGHAFDILILQMPPQHGKSMTVTETLPSWYLGRNPHHRVIQASYNSDFAAKFCRRNKEKITQYGKKMFGIEIGNVNQAESFELSNNVGAMLSRGIMGGITGNPANLIIIDDPIKNRQEADSETYRENMWDEWLNSIKTRLAAKAKVILILTRWHEDDLAGRIIQNEKNIKVINLPCEAEDNDPLGRTNGEALAPELGKDNAWLQEFKQGYMNQEGSRTWNALFQGRPTAEEGNMIKRSWWQYYDILPEMMEVIMSVDAAFKDEETSDYTCIQVWGKREADMYLIDCINDRMDFPTTLQRIEDTKTRYPKCRMILVEDKANGSAIIQMLRRKIAGIVAINPEGGKVSRVNAVSPAIESGNVFIPKYAPFTVPFIDQCSSFPSGKNDDMVDAMSQALNRFIFFGADVPKKTERDDWDLKNRIKSAKYNDARIDRSFIDY